MANKNNKVGGALLKLAHYEDISPYQFGEYKSKGGRWVIFGRDDDYLNYLRTLYMESPTHQSIVEAIINLSTGEGVEVVDPTNNPLSNKWLNDNFSKDVVKKLIGDLKMFGFAVVQVFEGKLCRYSEAIKYRLGEKCEDGSIDSIWFSNDWQDYSYKKNKPVKLPLYVEGCDDPISVAIIQLDKHGYEFYAPVDYTAGINYINIETEISKYHLSNIKNGLFPSFVINFVGDEFSDEQMQQTEDSINKKFGGSLNAGRAIVGFSSNPDNKTTIDTIDQPNLPETYTFLTKEASEKIMLAHGCTSPLLVGLTRDTGNGLGSNKDEMSQAYYLWYESKLKHYQNYILSLVTKIMNGNGLYAPIQFKTYNPFNVTDTTQQLSKINLINEVDSQVELNKIDDNKIKCDDILISEKLFTGKINEKALYKFVKSSNNNNIINKKYEILSNNGYLFKPNEDLIKNTEDYFFMEQTYLTKIKK